MKLEVGQFVRTKDGYISQYKYYDTTNAYMGKLLCIPLSNGTFANIEDIVKASYNIIDLIEENDLVTLTSKYCERDIYRVEGKFGEYISLDTLGDGTLIINNSKDIKSIVTKEQMEQMAYKVGE